MERSNTGLARDQQARAWCRAAHCKVGWGDTPPRGNQSTTTRCSILCLHSRPQEVRQGHVGTDDQSPRLPAGRWENTASLGPCPAPGHHLHSSRSTKGGDRQRCLKTVAASSPTAAAGLPQDTLQRDAGSHSRSMSGQVPQQPGTGTQGSHSSLGHSAHRFHLYSPDAHLSNCKNFPVTCSNPGPQRCPRDNTDSESRLG